MVGTVVVGAVAGGGVQAVGVVIGPHQVVRGSLAGRVGRVGGVGGGFLEGRVLRPKRTVDLVRGHVVKTVSVAAVPVQPDRLGGLEQGVGAQHVGVDEGVGPVDGAVHMGLGGKVDDGVHRIVAQGLRYRIEIPDVAVNEAEVGLFPQGCQVFDVAGVGQGIQHGHPMGGVALHPVVDEIGADKAGPARHQEGLGLVGHAASFARRSSMSSRPVCQAFGWMPK